MKILVLASSFIISLLITAQGKTKAPKKAVTKPVVAGGHNIKITLAPIKNAKVYLGSYYGKNKVLADSAFLNESSTGFFKGEKKLIEGVYFVVSPNYVIQFELLVGQNQSFSVVADTSRKDNVVISGSIDNDIFEQYTKGSQEKGMAMYQLNQQLKDAKTASDSASLQTQIKNKNKELDDYRNNITNKNPNSLLATLLNAMKRPDAPAIPIINGKPDSSFPYRFVKENYWNDVMFDDSRLLRTPFFEGKLDEYYKYYVHPNPDSIYNDVNYMLQFARPNKEMFAYLLTKFTNKYLNPEYMGQDLVFMHLFEDYYLKGDTTILDGKSKKMIFDRGYSLMLNQLNKPAPNLDLVDTKGKNYPLYAIKSNFTFIVFWDPTCGHCKEEIPRIDSMYKAKWKNLGVKVYAVNTKENLISDWEKFLKEKNISTDWLHLYQTKEARQTEINLGVPGYTQSYDVFKTPTMYLLDEEKKILAKQLSIQQFDDVIATQLRKKGVKQ